MNIIFLLAVIFFIFVLLIIEAGLYAYRKFRYPFRKQIRERLFAYGEEEEEEGMITDLQRKKPPLSGVPILNTLLQQLPSRIIEKLRLFLNQADTRLPLGFYLLLTLLLILEGFLVVINLTGVVGLSLFIGIILGILPYLYLSLKRKRWQQKFESQLADGLDFIARAMRAGNAFTTGMKLAADELGGPLGAEFRETINEINFGVRISDALRNLVKRVDCPDLKFFVVATNIQSEAGGNLAEIIENISRIIRERAKLEGKVKILTAEARVSAFILSVLPFVVMGILSVINPDYLKILFSDPTGKKIITIAMVMVLTGILVIYRMVKVKV